MAAADKAFQIVRPIDDPSRPYSLWEVVPEGIQRIREVQGQIAPLCVVGAYRTGKSYLLNRIAGTPDCFELGHSTDGHTKGLWAYIRPHALPNGVHLLLLDTEGIFDVEHTEDKSNQLLMMAILFSSLMVFNVKSTITLPELRSFSFATNSCTEMLMNALRQEQQLASLPEAQQRALVRTAFPSLVMLVRDAQLVKPAGQTATDMLDDKLQKEGSDVVTEMFVQRTCVELDQPVSLSTMRKHNSNLSAVPEEVVQEQSEFLQQMDGLITSLHQTMIPKLAPAFMCASRDQAAPASASDTSFHRVMSASLLAEYMTQIVDTLTSGNVVRIVGAWEAASVELCRQALLSAKAVYADQVDGLGKTEGNKLAEAPRELLSEQELSERVEAAQVAAVQQYECKASGDQSTRNVIYQELMEWLQTQRTSIMSAQTAASLELCDRCVEQCMLAVKEMMHQQPTPTLQEFEWAQEQLVQHHFASAAAGVCVERAGHQLAQQLLHCMQQFSTELQLTEQQQQHLTAYAEMEAKFAAQREETQRQRMKHAEQLAAVQTHLKQTEVREKELQEQALAAKASAAEHSQAREAMRKAMTDELERLRVQLQTAEERTAAAEKAAEEANQAAKSKTGEIFKGVLDAVVNIVGQVLQYQSNRYRAKAAKRT